MPVTHGSAIGRESLEYHERLPHGKLQIVPTKPCSTQRDLSLAYTPGVAEPVRAIARNPEDAYRYTAKGNLVAVITDGSAVLGLGNVVLSPHVASGTHETRQAMSDRVFDNLSAFYRDGTLLSAV